MIKLSTAARGAFKPIGETRSAQAAMMTLRPGATSDEELSNEHPRAEQWIYVVSGSGKATTQKAGGSRRVTALRAGTLVVIEKGERHQLKNTGKAPLRTLNFYVPPAYDREGEVRQRARR
jgi:oxalate decarboxylase/phosphoglucose isomerase-like protein (cupin superfamily)